MYVSYTWFYVHKNVRRKGTKQLGEQSVADMFKEYQQWNNGPMSGNSVFGQINNE